MKMKLSKKLMLFEEFTEVKTEVNSTVNTTVDYGTKGEIIQDVDTIISKLEDLANNLGSDRVGTTETTNEAEAVNEVADMASQILSAELYMIPLIIAAGSGAAVLGVGLGIYKIIDNAVKKKKIKKAYKKVHQNKIEAAKIQVGLTKLKGQELTAAQKKQSESLKSKADMMRNNAQALDDKVAERFPGFEKFFAVLRSQSNLEVAEIMLQGDLSDSERKRFESQLNNAKEGLELKSKKAKEDAAAAEEKLKSTPKEEQIKNLEDQKAELKTKIDSTDDEDQKEQLQQAYNMADERLKKLKGEKVEPAEPETEEPEAEEDPKVKAVEDKIKEYEDAIEQLSSKKDKASRDKVGILQAALANKKKELEKLKES
jgi:hypothetical protein